VKFLLLRPQAKCHKSCENFSAAGLSAVGLGLLDTEPDQQAVAQLRDKVSKLGANSKVIVTSTVAADLITQADYDWPPGMQMFAVGSGSGKILADHGFTVFVPTLASTEGLLALRQLAEVKDQDVLVVKGQGGRETLLEQLKLRGARVNSWELYRRIRVQKPQSTQCWQQEQIHCIIATSGELISEAFTQLPNGWLKGMPWIVVSQRLADIAAKLGIKRIVISRDASDDSLIMCAKQVIGSAEQFLEH
jgi:uroporphyrinogen-III synthase